MKNVAMVFYQPRFGKSLVLNTANSFNRLSHLQCSTNRTIKIAVKLTSNNKDYKDREIVFILSHSSFIQSKLFLNRTGFSTKKRCCYFTGMVINEIPSSVVADVCFGFNVVVQSADGVLRIVSKADKSYIHHTWFETEKYAFTSRQRGIATYQSYNMRLKEKSQRRRKRQSVQARYQTYHNLRFIELYIVLDLNATQLINKINSTAEKEALSLANYVNIVFKPLNIRVLLVGVDEWKHGNLMPYVLSKNSRRVELRLVNASRLLQEFNIYKTLSIDYRVKSDVALLITGTNLDGYKLGMTYRDTICSYKLGAAVVRINIDSPAGFASAVAHEIGHMLGFGHSDQELDTEKCRCHYSDDFIEACIMNSIQCE